MKQLALTTMGFLLLGVVAFGGAPANTYKGQIMDSTCAGNGNHDAGYKLTNTSTPKDCTLACVKGGATLVLYDAADKATYKLSNQARAKALAGRNVVVSGTLDTGTQTIKVRRITATPSQ